MRICNVYYDKIVYIIAIIQGGKLLKVTEIFKTPAYGLHTRFICGIMDLLFFKEEETMNVWTVLAFVLYLVMMIAIGVAFSRKSNNMSDYFLGGRGMNSWLTALSAQASDMSSWLLMGLPGAVYLSGLGDAWIAIGLGVGTYLNWLFVAKRLRKYSTVANDSITIPEFFQNRFNSQGSALKVACAVIIFIFFLVYTASSFNAAAKLLNTVFGVDYKIGLSIGVVVIMVYTFLGGYFAVVWTDFIQGMLMFFALLIVPIIAYAIVSADFSSTIQNIPGNPHYMNLFIGADGKPYSWQYIASNAGWGLGYFGMPHILVRFMSIKSSDMIRKSRIIATVWVAVTLVASVFTAVTGYVYMSTTGMELFTDAAGSETIFMLLVQKLTPGFIAGILLCAIVAAIMSTSDSQMLVTASAVSNDIYKSVINKKASDKQLLLLSRVAIIAVAVIAYFLALNPDNSVMSLVSYAWAGLGAAFGPAVLLSLFWKRMTMSGALAGIISGGVGVLVWNTFLTSTSPIFGTKFMIADTQLYELVPAFVLSFVCIVVVSLVSPKPSQKILDDFDKVKTVEV